ncbi:glycosyltransferase [Clavibacter capsici]|uniref:glycosyltransferase n=1 Tax=Clavibacter capsici TaxID=1874630 RepID=UPI00142870EC|nr:glycosyltransferase [Clavibacter capsici]QIS42033.1 glycosyltransferase [Clavibacter capsici]
MRIVQIINSLDVADGGPPRFAFELDAALNGLPHVTSQLVSVKGRREDSVVAAADPSSITRQRPRWLRGHEDALSLIGLLRMIRSADAVVIHGYFYPWLPVAAVVARILGADVHLTPHGSLTPYQQKVSVKRKRIYEAVVGRSLRWAITRIVVQSRIEQEQIHELLPQVSTFVGGVGTALPDRPRIGGDTHSPLRLLSVSRIAPKKNVEVMLRAVRTLLDAGENVRLTIAGTGRPDYEQALKGLADELRITDAVDFAGSVTGRDKKDLYEGSDIFLLPSDDENFGIGVAEALAHGVPVVATAAVAAASSITGDAGRVIARPSADLLAEAVRRLAEVEPFQAARQEAVSVAASDFDWPSVAGRWLEGMRPTRTAPSRGRSRRWTT